MRDCFSAKAAEQLKRLGVKLGIENERGESFYNPFLPDVVKDLRQKHLAIESAGAIVIEVPGFESPLIIEKKSTAAGTPGGPFIHYSLP